MEGNHSTVALNKGLKQRLKRVKLDLEEGEIEVDGTDQTRMNEAIQYLLEQAGY